MPILSMNLTSLEGPVCPGVVQFTCIATNVDTLRWSFNDINSNTIALYVYIPNRDTFPLSLLTSNNNTSVTILSAVQNPQNHDQASFNSTLTMRISALHQMAVQHIICGSLTNHGNLSTANLMVIGELQ